MYSINFPNMFSTYKTNLSENREATLQNLILLLKSDKSSLFGDPYYGSNIKKFLFNPNNQILADLIIDDIYTCILDFMPQVYIQRKDIIIQIDGSDLIVNINCMNKSDMTYNLYSIRLTDM